MMIRRNGNSRDRARRWWTRSSFHPNYIKLFTEHFGRSPVEPVPTPRLVKLPASENDRPSEMTIPAPVIERQRVVLEGDNVLLDVIGPDLNDDRNVPWENNPGFRAFFNQYGSCPVCGAMNEKNRLWNIYSDTRFASHVDKKALLLDTSRAIADAGMKNITLAVACCHCYDMIADTVIFDVDLIQLGHRRNRQRGIRGNGMTGSGIINDLSRYLGFYD